MERVPSVSPVIVVTGPTASGKSALALSLVASITECKAEIISADSVQVYRDFNIGSAKPSEKELAQVPHHLVSAISPLQPYDAGTFAKEASSIIRKLHQHDTLAVVSGGTGLYVRALLHGIVETEEISVEAKELLQQREAQIVQTGGHLLNNLREWYAELEGAEHRDTPLLDVQRLRRALLVRLSMGQSLRALQSAHQHQITQFPAFVICLLPERGELYQRIDARVLQMMRQGFIEEVEELLKKYPENAKPFQAIGYRQVVSFLQGRMTKEVAISTIQQETRRFAKRQLTWWRHQPRKLGWKNIAETESFCRDGEINSEVLSREIRGFLKKDRDTDSLQVLFCPLRDFSFG